MMRLAFPTYSAAVFLAVCSFAGSQAATISTSISTGPFSTNSITSITIPDFNSSLGTLTSVTASLGGSYLYTVSVFGPDKLDFVLFSQYRIFFETFEPGPTASGTYSYSGSGSVSDAQDLAFYSSAAPGTTQIEFYVLTRYGLATLTSPNFTGTLTYTYTPFAATTATPEPSSLVLLGTGVLGVGGVVRRRWMAV